MPQIKHRATPQFWAMYDALPAQTKLLADKNFTLMKNDPHHPSLLLKQIGRYWTVRVGRRYRAVAVKDEDALIWFWIGTHAEYDALIKRN